VTLIWKIKVAIKGLFSGWGTLAARFPDRADPPTFSLAGKSGWVGAARFDGILRLEACPSGLRISMDSAFKPFSQPFFVPWELVTPSDLIPVIGLARLDFGRVGGLIIRKSVARRLVAGYKRF
jgi:hypothetical protein